jgi:hypothetical protein
MVGLPSSDVPNRLFVYGIDGVGNLSNVVNSPVSVGNTDDGGFVIQSQCSSMIFIAETADNQVRILNSDLSQYGIVTQASGLVDYGPFGLLENATLKRVYVSNKPSNSLKVLAECPGPLSPIRPASTATPTFTRLLTQTPTLAPTRTNTPAASQTPIPAASQTPIPAVSKAAPPTATPTSLLSNTLTRTPTPIPSSTPTR